MQDTVFTGRLRALALVLVAAALAGCGEPPRDDFAMVPHGGAKPVVAPAPAKAAPKIPPEGGGGRC